MKIGVSLAYWPWLTFEEQISIARMADEIGLDSVWVSEAWGQDVVSMLGLLAGQTERVGLGTAIMQIPARQATAAAMAAATIDVISGGRLRLGLGPSGPQVSEGWYGVAFDKPLKRTRDYVETIRRALAGETLEPQLPEGQGTGLGKSLRLLARPVRKEIPIYLGATAPKGLAQCGEIADGWIGVFIDTTQPEATVGAVLDAVEGAGRARSDFDVSTLIPTAVAETEEQAIAAVRPWIAFYLGAMGAKGKNFYVDMAHRYGFGEEADRVQDLYLDGDTVASAKALSPELIARVSITATPDTIDARLGEFAAVGVDTMICIPCGDVRMTVDTLGAVAVDG